MVPDNFRPVGCLGDGAHRAPQAGLMAQHRPTAMVASDAGEDLHEFCFAALPSGPAVMAHTVTVSVGFRIRAHARTCRADSLVTGDRPVVVCHVMHDAIDPALHRADQA